MLILLKFQVFVLINRLTNDCMILHDMPRYGRITWELMGYGEVRQDTRDTAGYAEIRRNTSGYRIWQDT